MDLSKGKALGTSSIVSKRFDFKEKKLGQLAPKINPLLKNVNVLAAIDSDEDDSDYGNQDG